MMLNFATRTGLSHPAEFGTLDYRLETFRGSLFPMCGSGSGAAPITQMLFVTHIFVHAASLQLHVPHTSTSHVSHSKCLSAAGSVVELLSDACLVDWEYADPVVGVRRRPATGPTRTLNNVPTAPPGFFCGVPHRPAASQVTHRPCTSRCHTLRASRTRAASCSYRCVSGRGCAIAFEA